MNARQIRARLTENGNLLPPLEPTHNQYGAYTPEFSEWLRRRELALELDELFLDGLSRGWHPREVANAISLTIAFAASITTLGYGSAVRQEEREQGAEGVKNP